MGSEAGWTLVTWSWDVALRLGSAPVPLAMVILPLTSHMWVCLRCLLLQETLQAQLGPWADIKAPTVRSHHYAQLQVVIEVWTMWGTVAGASGFLSQLSDTWFYLSIWERKWASHVHDRTRLGVIRALSSSSGWSHMHRNRPSADCMSTSHLPWPRDIWDSGDLSQLQDGLDLETWLLPNFPTSFHREITPARTGVRGTLVPCWVSTSFKFAYFLFNIYSIFLYTLNIFTYINLCVYVSAFMCVDTCATVCA